MAIDEHVMVTVSMDSAQAVSGTRQIADALSGIGPAGKRAGSEAAEGLGSLTEAVGELQSKLVELVGGLASIEGLKRLFESAAEGADRVQDASRALVTFTGSLGAATQAMAFFEQAQQHTRSTALELAHLYTEVLPLGIARSWSPAALQQITVQLDQLAAKAGKAPDEMLAGFQRLLTGAGGGGGAGRNPLLKVLGITADDVKNSTDLAQLLVERLSQKAGDVADSFASASHKIHEELQEALGRGFMETFGQGSDAMTKFKAAFTDPAFISGLEAIGKLMGSLAIEIGDLVGWFGKLAAKLQEPVAVNDHSLVGVLERVALLALKFTGPGAAIKAMLDGQAKVSADAAKLVAETATSFGDYGPLKVGSSMGVSGASGIGGLGPQKDAVADVTKTILEAQHVATTARQAFDKLFEKPETDPLLRAIQTLDQQAIALADNLLNAEAKLRDQASSDKTPAAAKGAMLAAADSLHAFVVQMGDAIMQKEQFLKDDALAKSFDEIDKAISKADDTFGQFIETSTRGLDAKGGGAAITEQLKAIQTAMDAALAQARQQDAMGIWALTPDRISEIERQYSNLGHDLLAQIQADVTDAKSAAKEAIAVIFENFQTNGQQGGFAMLFQQIQQATDALAAALPKAASEKFKTDFAPELTTEFEKAAKLAADQFKNALTKLETDIADIFTLAAQGGAGLFGKIASKFFLDGVHEGGTQLGKMFSRLVANAFGAPPDSTDLSKYPGGAKDAQFLQDTAAANDQNAKIIGAISAGLGAIGNAIEILKNAGKGQFVNVTTTALSFAATGAAIGTAINAGLGTIIGALVGAIVGVIVAIGANAKARASLPYAQYGIKDGQAYVEAFPGLERNFGNITQAQLKDMTNQLQVSFENTTNDFVSLVLKFPHAVTAAITASNFAPTMDTLVKVSRGWLAFLIDPAGVNLLLRWTGLGQSSTTTGVRGDLRNPTNNINALKNFNDDFQNWVNNTLPKEIIASFEKPLAAGFETLGLSAAKFQQIWDRLSQMSSKDAIKFLNDLQSALISFADVVGLRGPASGFLSSASVDLTGGGDPLSMGRIENARAFADALAQSDVALVQMGADMNATIGPDQITKAKAWGDALVQREAAIKQFFQKIASDIDSVINTYQNKIRDLTLIGIRKPDGSPDIQGQVEFLKKHADDLVASIKHASTEGEIMTLSGELFNTITQIQQLGGSVSKAAAEAYRLWALGALQSAQDLVTGNLQRLANDVRTQNDAFVSAIQGFIDAFRAATAQLTPAGTVPTGTTPDTTNGGRGGGGRVIPFDRNRNLTLSPAASSSDQVAILRDIHATLKSGAYVSGSLDVVVEGQAAGTVPLASGFRSRTLAGRSRA